MSYRIPKLDDTGKIAPEHVPDPEAIGAQPAGDYATAAQGAKADTAVQPAALDALGTQDVVPGTIMRRHPTEGWTGATVFYVNEPQAPEPNSMTRRDFVEGLTSSSAVDATVAANINNSASGTSAALKAAYGLRPDRGQNVAAKLDTNVGDAVVCLFGDSTGNETTEWFYKLLQSLATAHPAWTIKHQLWNDTTQAYDAATTLQTGSIPASGITAKDTFTRSGDLRGSTPDIGPAWGGDSNAAGQYTLDGSKVAYTGTLGGAVILDGSVAGDSSLTVTLGIDTTNTGTAKQTRFYVKYLGSTNHLYAQLATSNLQATLTLNQRIGGTVTTLATVTSAIPTNAALTTFPVTVAVSGSTFTATINGKTATATLDPATLTALAAASAAGFSASNVGTTFDDFVLTVTGTAASVPVLTAYNASMPGSTLDYHTARLAAMVPVEPDLCIVSSCHNYTSAPATYTAAVGTFVDLLAAAHPGTGVIVSSQNPRKAPATDNPGHLARLTALRPYVERRGWGYLPVVEAFLVKPNGGAAYIKSDGVHPTNTEASPTGSELWRDQALAYLTGLSRRPAA